MNCEHVIDQLSAWIDGELPPQEGRAIEEHLGLCSDCGNVAAELRVIHQELGREFCLAPESAGRVADRVINQLPLQDAAQSRLPAKNWTWLASVLAAVAAGFILALCTLPRADRISVNSRNGQLSATPFAAVRVSTGPLEVSPLTGQLTFTKHDSSRLEVGTKLRTRNHKSELQTTSGVTIRLDSGTQISVPSVDEVVLESGRLWCQTGDGPTFAISGGGARINMTRATCDIKRDPRGTELIALDGSIQVLGNDWQSNVETGTKVSLGNHGIVNQGGPFHPVIETRWIHELLLQKDTGEEELQQRVEQLWASVGYSKVCYLYEEELRSLGGSCVNPLSSFLASRKEFHQRDHRRVLAAQILADVADFSAISRLILLLDDEDGQVRFHIARGLHRITGRDIGISQEDWKTATAEQRAASIAEWRKWLSGRRRSPNAI